MNCDHTNHWPNIAGSGIWWCPDCGALNRGNTWVLPKAGQLNSGDESTDQKVFAAWRWPGRIGEVLNMNLHLNLIWLWPLWKMGCVDLVWVSGFLDGIDRIRLANLHDLDGSVCLKSRFYFSEIILLPGGYWVFNNHYSRSNTDRWWFFGEHKPSTISSEQSHDCGG